MSLAGSWEVLSHTRSMCGVHGCSDVGLMDVEWYRDGHNGDGIHCERKKKCCEKYRLKKITNRQIFNYLLLGQIKNKPSA